MATQQPAVEPTMPPVAIIGVGCVLPPTSRTMDAYWANLSQGVSGITSAVGDLWDPSLYRTDDPSVDDKTRCVLGGAVIDYAFPFDRFDLTPAQREALEGANRTQLMSADAALQAIASSAYDRDRLRRSKVELFVGNMVGDEKVDTFGVRGWTELMWPHIEATPTYQALPSADQFIIRGRYSELADERLCPLVIDPPSLLASATAPRVVRALGLDCPGVLVDGACASGLLVVDTAIAALLESDVDVVVAIGVMANRSVTANVAFDKIGGLALTASRPLADDAEGLVPGEGSGAVLLKRLDRALADGDRVYGVIRGVATTSDGAGKAIFAPDSRGQVAAMRRALDRAGATARDIDYVETHATGTPTGDATEVESIDQVVTADARSTPLPIGSGKALIGHGFPVAGMANLLKILLAFDHGVVPRVYGVDRPNEALRRASERVRVVLEEEPWPVAPDRPRRALTNAFGFGGVNSTVVVEQFDEAYHRALSAVEPPARSGQMAVIAVAGELPGLSITDSLPSPDALADCLERIAQSERDCPITGWKFPYRQIRIPPITLVQTDRSQQLFLTVALSALGQANLLDGRTAREPDRIATIVGAASGLYATIERSLRIHEVEVQGVVDALVSKLSLPPATAQEWHDAIHEAVNAVSGPTTEAALPGYMDNVVAGRVANRFDLRGPNFLVDADFAAFGPALEVTSQILDRRDADFVVLGGTNSLVFEAMADIWRQQAGARFTVFEAACALVLCRPEDVPEGTTPLGFLSVGKSAPGRFPRVHQRVSALGADGILWALQQLARRAGARDDDFVAETVLGSVIADRGWPVRFSTRPAEPGTEPPQVSAAAGGAVGAPEGDALMVEAGTGEMGERGGVGVVAESAVVEAPAESAVVEAAAESAVVEAAGPGEPGLAEPLHVVEASSLDDLLAVLQDWSAGAGPERGPALPGADRGWRLVFEADSAAERAAKATLGRDSLDAGVAVGH